MYACKKHCTRITTTLEPPVHTKMMKTIKVGTLKMLRENCTCKQQKMATQMKMVIFVTYMFSKLMSSWYRNDCLLQV